MVKRRLTANRKDLKKVNLAIGVIGALAILLAGYKKSKQREENLYKVSLCLGKQKEKKDEIASAAQTIFEDEGWAYAETKDYGKYAHKADEMLAYFVLLASEEELYQQMANCREKWDIPFISYVKEEKPYRRL